MSVRIYQQPKNAMQSGRARTGDWVLEFEAADRIRHDPLTGWTGSGDTNRQLQLRFDTLDAAKTYAIKRGLECTVLPPRPYRIKLQSYADNFR